MGPHFHWLQDRYKSEYINVYPRRVGRGFHRKEGDHEFSKKMIPFT